MLLLINILLSGCALSLSFYRDFNYNSDKTHDYKPLTVDKHYSRKVGYWCSQYTNQINTIILISYLCKIFQYKKVSDTFMKIAFSNLFTVVLLFWILIAKNSTFFDLMTFNNLYLHLFVLPICAYDVIKNKDLLFTLEDIKYTLSYFIMVIFSNIINFRLRNVWAYGLLKFVNPYKDLSGYGYLCLSIIISISSHLFIYKVKKNLLNIKL